MLEDKRQYLYQALACHHPDRHLHLKCNQCGRFIHMQEEVSSQILQQITREFGFLVDEEQTVLYGHCTQCHTPADA